VPTYQYRCTECGEPHEAVQSFTEPALTDCPKCGGRLRKVFSSVGVVFKGSGFYRTDSRDKPDSADSQPKRTVDAKSDGKSDSKPDGKSDAKSDGKSDSKSDRKSDSATKSTSGAPTSSPSTTKSSGTSSAA
jgi:putative FmdB family regulatory protein